MMPLIRPLPSRSDALTEYQKERAFLTERPMMPLIPSVPTRSEPLTEYQKELAYIAELQADLHQRKRGGLLAAVRRLLTGRRPRGAVPAGTAPPS